MPEHVTSGDLVATRVRWRVVGEVRLQWLVEIDPTLVRHPQHKLREEGVAQRRRREHGLHVDGLSSRDVHDPLEAMPRESGRGDDPGGDARYATDLHQSA